MFHNYKSVLKVILTVYMQDEQLKLIWKCVIGDKNKEQSGWHENTLWNY